MQGSPAPCLEGKGCPCPPPGSRALLQSCGMRILSSHLTSAPALLQVGVLEKPATSQFKSLFLPLPPGGQTASSPMWPWICPATLPAPTRTYTAAWAGTYLPATTPV